MIPDQRQGASSGGISGSAVETSRADVSRVLRGERRPSRALLTYYLIQSIVTGPALIVLLPLRWFRYHTLRYSFDDQGVTMRWGILFRREISLTYARLQDIHLVSNVVERWLGLGRVQLQTASGQAGAEMVIEGLPDYEHVRNELYRRMRGARGQVATPHVAQHPQLAIPDSAPLDELTAALRDAAAELRLLREQLSAEAKQ